MNATTLLTRPELSVVDYRCTAGPADTPFVERHRGFDIAFVRKGSFGYRVQRRVFELVAGSFLIGRPGDEYLCTHDHHAGGDECLAFHLSEAFVDEIRGAKRAFSARAVPPLSELVVLGELAQAVADGRSDAGLDEAGALLAQRFVEVVSRERSVGRSPLAIERRRAVAAALWIEAHSLEPLGLADAAREAGLSVFHFLRTFSNVLGVTPHQYLIRSRLRAAARRLAQCDEPITEIALDVGFGDLSNFIRSFRRAAGISPRAFRRVARGQGGPKTREPSIARFSK